MIIHKVRVVCHFSRIIKNDDNMSAKCFFNLCGYCGCAGASVPGAPSIPQPVEQMAQDNDTRMRDTTIA